MLYAPLRVHLAGRMVVLRAVLDTGQHDSLSMRADALPPGARDEDLEIVNEHTRRWSLQQSTGRIVRVPRIELGGTTVTGVLAFIQRSGPRRTECAIGAGLLRRFSAVRVDVRSNDVTLDLSPRSPYAAPASAMRLSLVDRPPGGEREGHDIDSDGLAVPVVTIDCNTRSCLTVIDTGFTGYLAVGVSTAEAMGVRMTGASVPATTHPGTLLPTGSVDVVKIGERMFRDVPAVVFDDSALAGSDAPRVLMGLGMLREFASVTFDWHASAVWLEPIAGVTSK